MWIRTSSVLLATLVVSGLSLPHPDDSAYQIPEVGTGERSQYYVLHSDGTFKYGFDSGDGAFESVKSHTVGDREGKFGYVDPDGKTIRLEYEAGQGGFVARGDHLPKPSPELAQALAHVVANARPFVDPLASEDSDASYGFEFQSDDHSRNEQSDSDGTVTGSYSYVDENGVTRSFTYRAGKGIGFVIEGDGLTQDVSVPSPSSLRETHRSSRPTITGTHQASTRRTQIPSRHFGDAFGTSTTRSYTGPEANIAFTRSQIPGDASYSFSFDAGDHSRSESSDSDLNVDGTFSFVSDDGNRRTVNYVAGSSTGFQAEGGHLPRAPTVSGSSVQVAPRGHTSETSRHRGFEAQTRQHGQSASVGASVPSAVSSYLPPPSVGTTGSQTTRSSSGVSSRPSSVRGFQGTQPTSFSSTRPFEEANVQSSSSPSGPYSFSYKTSSHSRSESGDADNNVVGEFDFVADDDGQRRQVTYEAGSATGFIAEGAHIPVGPEVPGAPSGQPTGRIVPVSSVPFEDPLADPDSDASYNFEFESDTYSRRESSDRDGNVVGSYTVVDDDGTKRTYNFKAGQGIGFEAEEVSRSQGPAPVRPTSHTGHQLPQAHRASRPTPIHGAARPTSSRGVAKPTLSHGATGPIYSSGARRPTSSQIPAIPTSSYLPPSPHTEVAHTASVGTRGHTQVRPSSATPSFSVPSRIPFRSSSSAQSSSEFTLNRYDASPNSEKFGYVLRFN